MNENAGSAPRARREGLVIQELPDKVLVYDRERDPRRLRPAEVRAKASRGPIRRAL